MQSAIANFKEASILGVVPIEDRKTTRIFKDHNCSVIHTAVPEITRQANAGFLAADTEYVQVFDSDDIMYPNMPASLYSVAEHTGSDVVWSDYELWKGNSYIEPIFCFDFMKNLDYRCFIPELCLFRKETWMRLGGFDEDLWRYAQWDYFLRLRNSGGKFMRVPFFGFRYVQSENQISRKIGRGDYAEIDNPSWDKFKNKHPRTAQALTVGHGAEMRRLDDVPA